VDKRVSREEGRDNGSVVLSQEQTCTTRPVRRKRRSRPAGINGSSCEYLNISSKPREGFAGV